MNKNIIKYAAAGTVALLAGAVAAVSVHNSKELTKEKIAEVSVLNAQIAELNNKLNLSETELTKMGTSYEEVVAQIESLKIEFSEKEKEIIEEAKQVSIEVAKESNGYLIDDVALNGNFSKTLKDNRVEKLLDGEITFDGKEYNVEEQILFNGDLKPITSVDVDDEFGKNIYIGADRNAVKYKYNFKESIPLTSISEDTPLRITVLGKDFEIINYTANSFDYKESSEEVAKIGDVVAGVEVKNIGENAILLSYNGVSKVLSEGDVHDFDGVEIKVASIFYVADKEDRMAVLEGASELVKTITTGDSMEIFDGIKHADDSLFVWDVDFSTTKPSIGVTLNQRMNDLNDDFKPLDRGEQLVLPNDYAAITYLGTNDVDYNDLTVEWDQKDLGAGYVNVLVAKSASENFLVNDNNYDTLYINGTEIYVKENGNYVNATSYAIENEDDTQFSITPLANNLTIQGVKFDVNYTSKEITSVVYDGLSRNNHDNDLLTFDGIVVKDVEANLEDNIVEMQIPSEKVTVEIKVE